LVKQETQESFAKQVLIEYRLPCILLARQRALGREDYIRLDLIDLEQLIILADLVGVDLERIACFPQGVREALDLERVNGTRKRSIKLPLHADQLIVVRTLRLLEESSKIRCAGRVDDRDLSMISNPHSLTCFGTRIVMTQLFLSAFDTSIVK
jgi:hypothetical protein